MWCMHVFFSKKSRQVQLSFCCPAARCLVQLSPLTSVCLAPGPTVYKGLQTHTAVATPRYRGQTAWSAGTGHWLGWQREAESPRRSSSCCGRCCSCRLFGRSIWDWSLSSFDCCSGLLVKAAHGAAAGNETSLPGGPPQMSGQTGLLCWCVEEGV